VVGHFWDLDTLGLDIKIFKYTTSGNLIWNVTIHEFYQDEYPRIVVTKDGQYLYIACKTSPVGLGSLFTIFKYHSNGTRVWRFRWLNMSDSEGYDLCLSPDEKYIYATGKYYTKESSDSTNIAVLKLHSNGTLIWNRTWGVSSNDEVGRAIEVSECGSYIYIAGYSFIDSNKKYNMILLKYDSNGTLIWAKEMGGAMEGFCFDMELDPMDGSIYLCCRNHGSDRYGDAMLLKLDLNGSIIWNRTWGEVNRIEEMRGLCLSQNNTEIYMVGARTIEGCCYLSILLLKYFKNGTLDFYLIINSSASLKGYSIDITEDGLDLYIGGAIDDNLDGNYDFWIIKLTSRIEETGQIPSFLFVYCLFGLIIITSTTIWLKFGKIRKRFAKIRSFI